MSLEGCRFIHENFPIPEGLAGVLVVVVDVLLLVIVISRVVTIAIGLVSAGGFLKPS